MNNVRSISLMTFSMICFAVQDLFIKWVTADIPNGQVIFLLGLGGMVFFAIVARIQGLTLFPPLSKNLLLYTRSIIEGFCAICIVTALSKVPLATFATVFQAVPLVVTLGAALFLGETVGWRRWVAILVGFVGVLLIIRPGTSGFDPATLWVLASVALISARDVISRRLPSEISTMVVSFQGFGSLVMAGPALALLLNQPVTPMTAGNWTDIGVMTVLGIVGYFAMVVATRIGEASGLAPFRYSRMVFALILGMIFLNEQPDLLTYVGAALIIGSGLFSYLRERRLAARS